MNDARRHSAPAESRPGEPEPLGATWDGTGTNFCVFSDVAERVELCLFDDAGRERRVEMLERTGYRWHCFLPDVGPGTRYGYRVHGPWDPARGHRCNPQKLLLDPYAKSIVGAVAAATETLGHREHDENARDDRDSAPFVPRSVVTHPFFDWGHDRPPRVPWHDTVLYELHVKGFTARHPAIPPALRGTYAGLAHPAAIDHLVRLGVTSVELMPIHTFASEPHLVRRGLVNYWGYNTIGYFAPHAGYARRGADPISELKSAIKALHEARIEVLLDVVYNHTGEGDHRGPTLCFRGFDNASYYRLDPQNPSRYQDFTGCGNTLDATQPHVLQLIMDSLRHWVEEFHVDGFRFDLAAALARGEHGAAGLSSFLDVVQQDPIVSRVKLIAEPWDIGWDGYHVGRFPPHWSEWNGKYRDATRRFWRGDPGSVGELATRLAGSADLYANNGRRPFASVNFVTAHDGFTLRDLVSYERKHNERNGEENRDGSNDNRSDNHGVEGPTDDPKVNALRARQQRNFLATIFLSQGVPLLLAGDEMGRTQLGNNNAYCLDDETSWVDWSGRDRALLEHARSLIALRRAHPVFRRHTFFRGDGDVAWYRHDGAPMGEHDWTTSHVRSLGMHLDGLAIGARDASGAPLVGDSFYVFFCAQRGPIELRLPRALASDEWFVALDTSGAREEGGTVHGPLALEGPLVLVLQQVRARHSLAP
ncbi:glycogen debranching protein GlgX [Sandaracinus amylolyticus]|uniref:Glycogen debranching enzyme n=1 Tax=Sandaracinus amylolyticus TaxID=927083 RepID=A0A0F6W018_9BACT|nr:glycogen debranching protein GlgX [Sandaracinus amylolyticus]AKF03796.1 Glycogen debranching enzyme [Sandaracinus amylolyticus]